ncbi:MAG: bifunctional phosphopantothenoylcysteine decarboxylase/phosphopantothenate--cysteine ligase CoaBC [Chitinophagales bacterium]|nr:bifunctional phosphopantothenoylcysteine decarboxylase/phosphopantothenate--cysteine ligase CoaBC [Bacteroidota bacterium]
MTLQGKRILLGVCGGIAAYKSVYLLRSLIKKGADVKVIMTPGANAFVGPLTFSALSKHPVGIEFFNPQTGAWFNHVELGLWAELMIIAPATANTIAKMNTGICDNLLLATYLSAKCPVMIAPAMDLDMWLHPTTQTNIKSLAAQNISIVEPGTGELASGLHGKGRMAEPEIILQSIHHFFIRQDLPSFIGKKIVITAGPTYEKIDPVRFIGNHSSGKMGFALAEILHACGADVTMVHGPVNLPELPSPIKTIAVESAAEMFEETAKEFDSCNIFISAAAVADFTPKNISTIKIKKSADTKEISIQLEKTIDILATLSACKKKNQLIVGFALETNDAIANAQKKLQQKNLDIIVLNILSDAGAGFGHDTNKITILDKHNNISTFELKTKIEVAKDITRYISKTLYA